ncbi:hypothetical protein EcE24377A_0646 [Escherichia coli O139:H28 str. E24377A]|uniref:Uncharacterized protein n=1 Tax=Escherichia coli O139:H28 (strain E24377A / ETEC) TaxID=331111 RepID=A7ZJ09_ECO24|nr:hypothetical protein EcE24377A_0646 [Escherichia coli O139:H28 str. E24377A]
MIAFCHQKRLGFSFLTIPIAENDASSLIDARKYLT